DHAPTLESMLIGLIANPISSKDIRRLTGLARVVDAEEKANLLARLLVGLGSHPEVTVLALDDRAGLVRRAVSLAGDSAPRVDFLPITATGEESDTKRAAAHLAGLMADALVTLGGDGTVRAAVEGWPEAPLVPIAAGTNNASALTLEPTVIGLATVAGVKSQDPFVFVPTTALQVDISTGHATAVIDVVSVRGRWLGAGALWEPELLMEAVATSADPTAVGIASVSAGMGPLAPGRARWIRFGPGQTVKAIFGPGLVLDVAVAEHSDLPIGSEVTLDVAGGVVALDGERRIATGGSRVRVVPGPRVLDPDRALRVKGPLPLARPSSRK
ncbi:MAG TPA: NAD(+)/NADH kinase, partial [Acidimicrobiia bacterium]|nr:NAD(+)/NADH kinase [Acidimicrobiia bacterium]